MTTTTSFTTREQYLAWRAAWKAEYKNLSTAIRTIKNAIAEIQRDDRYAGSQQNRLSALSYDATFMLDDLMMAKIRSGLYRENPAISDADLESQIEIRREIALAKRTEKCERAKAAAQAARAELVLMKKAAATPTASLEQAAA